MSSSCVQPSKRMLVFLKIYLLICISKVVCCPEHSLSWLNLFLSGDGSDRSFFMRPEERHTDIHTLTPGPGPGVTYRRKNIPYRWEADDSKSTDQRKCGLTGCYIRTPPPRMTLWPLFSYYSRFPPCVNVWNVLFISATPLSYCQFHFCLNGSCGSHTTVF